MKTMKEQKLFGCASPTSGSFKNDRRAGRGLDNPTWVFAAIAAACIWSSRPCEGQIEVSAYISNTGSNSVSVIDTETNTVVGSPLSGLKALIVTVGQRIRGVSPAARHSAPESKMQVRAVGVWNL